MARTPWVFNGYSFPVNPEKDSNWTYEEVQPESVAIGASRSTFQYGGTKSGRRQISGWLYGTDATTQHNTMKSWHRNRTIATLVDHTGAATTARLSKFDAEFVQSNTEWKAGRNTWRYNAEFTEEA